MTAGTDDKSGSFHPDHGEEVRYFEEGMVYSIQIESNLRCQQGCRYCYAASEDGLMKELPSETIRSIIDSAAGMRVNRDAQPVLSIIPGLIEKFTGPITPMKPAKKFASPVMNTPLFIRPSLALTSRISLTDWIDPRSLIKRAIKQKKNEIITPG